MFREKPTSAPGSTETSAMGKTKYLHQQEHFKEMHQAMLEKLMEALPAFIYIFDQEQQCFVYESQNIQPMFGYGQESLTGMGFHKMMELVHQSDTDQVLKAEMAFLETVSNFPADQRKDIKSIMNFRIIKADGSATWVQQQKIIFETGDKGEPLFVMALITDINVTRKCHEFFSAIVYRNKNSHWTELDSREGSQLLSNRETQILQLLAKGKSSKIIAAELSISVNTVNNHRKNMLLKTGACNIAELVSYGLSHGLI